VSFQEEGTTTDNILSERRRSSAAEIIQAFSRIDANGDGVLSLEEVTRAVNEGLVMLDNELVQPEGALKWNPADCDTQPIAVIPSN